jgi:MauM/NapG family ferredoxin protein
MVTNLLRVLRRMLGARSPLRPPGAVAERDFVRRCIKCGKCAQVCPDRTIRMASMQWGSRYGTPMIFARDIPCYLCMKCPEVCPTGALDTRLSRPEDVDMGVAVIDEDTCLAFNGIICRSCYDHCPFHREGIIMRDEHYPVVNPDVCVGCGICEHVCVADERSAITVRPPHEQAGRRGFLQGFATRGGA